MLRAGERIGDWVVVKQIGEGGMGAVFLCHNQLSERMKAAVKVLKSHDLGEARERFIREMEALAHLQHPSIVRVMGSGEDSELGILWMAMEMLDGENLEDRLARGPMDRDEALPIFRKMVAALTYAHQMGVRHRDIKPANIMLCNDGAVKVLDFGIAVQAGRTRLTNDRTVPGTLPYIPPEIFEGTKPDPVLADVYASGLVLYEMVMGEPAYPEAPELSAGQRMAQIMAAKLTGGSVDPGNKTVRAIRQLISWTTEPEPDDRMPQMAMVLAATDSIIAGEIDNLPELKRDDGVMLEAPAPGRPTGFTGKNALRAAASTMSFDFDTAEEEELTDDLYVPTSQMPVVAGVVVGGLAITLVAVLFGGPSMVDTPPDDPVVDPNVPVGDIPATGPGSALLPFNYEMIEVRPGDFWMGSRTDEPGAKRDEFRHPVSITSAYLIGKTEVTQELWTAVMGTNPSANQTYGPDDNKVLCEKWGVGEKLPVMCITWEEAAAFTNALSALEGLEPVYSKGDDGSSVWNREASGYRLPSEAEWEYAARGGTQDMFAGSNMVSEACTYANLANPQTKNDYYAWLTWKAMECDDGHKKLAEVAQLKPNGYGLHDMNGNIMEWVWDEYAPYEGQPDAPAIDSKNEDHRVRRGGDWSSGIKAGRVASRDHGRATDRLPRAGLRIVRNAE